MAWLWGVTAVCSLLLRPFWLALAPLVPRCPFRTITGIPCPTCGTTRAAVALLDGQLAQALALNPLSTLAAVGFLAGGLIAPVWAAVKLPVPEVPTPLPRWARLGIVALLLVGWAWVIVRS